MNNKGSYFVSKFKSSLGRSFGHSTRTLIADNKGYPGPGLYTVPSDFPEIRSKSKRGNSQSMSTLLAKKSSMSKTTKETTSKEWCLRIFCQNCNYFRKFVICKKLKIIKIIFKKWIKFYKKLGLN